MNIVTSNGRPLPPGGRLRGLAARPPGWILTGLALLGSLLVLVADSVPGFAVFSFLAGGLVLGAVGVVWAIRLVLYRRRETELGAGLAWLFAVPILLLTVVALTAADVPLKVRWTFSRGAFEGVVDLAPPAGSRTEWLRAPGEGRIGLYNIVSVQRVGEAVIFHESTGNVFDDAGFAYLPNGPFDELNTGWFENPQFRHLGGSWYAWTASW